MGKILVIRAGGTIEQIRNSEDVLVPTKKDFFYLLPELKDMYNFDKEYLGSFDSTEITLDKRKEIAKTIDDNYDNYDGFVITHGTDTMANTASALNYMLQDIQKPIVITGSQIPIYEYDTDAKSNIRDSFVVANSKMQGSIIVFDHKIIRGSRASKIDANNPFAFDSPKDPLEHSTKIRGLGKIVNGKIAGNNCNELYIPSKKIKYFDDFAKGVVSFSSQSSGVHPSVLEDIIKNPNVPGLIFAGYGVGNVESRYKKAFEIARDLYKPIGLTTSCSRGSTNAGTYETGNWLSSLGVFELYDMTQEAAVQKMMYSIGKSKSDGFFGEYILDNVKNIMQTPIGHDITPKH